MEKIEVYRRKPPAQLDGTQSIADYLDETVLIDNFEVVSLNRFDIAVIHAITENGEKIRLRTSSKIQLRQLKEEILPLLREGKKVVVKITRRKNYYTFETPSEAELKSFQAKLEKVGKK